MFVNTPIIISSEEKEAVDAALKWSRENVVMPINAASYKITRIKSRSPKSSTLPHRSLYVYDSTGKRILEKPLPMVPNDPGTHSYKTFSTNGKLKHVFHGPKGSRQLIGSSFFKPICTQKGEQGLMKQTEYLFPKAAEIQQQFEQLSGVTSRLPSPSYHLGNVIEETKTKDLKTTQYMHHAGPDLFDILHTTLSDNKKLSIAISCLKKLAELHARNIVHGDIKTENICIHPNGRTSIIDFDVSFRSDVLTDRRKPCGTYGYMPPEYFTGDKHPPNFEEIRFSNEKRVTRYIHSMIKPNHGTLASKASDVYSMGIILLELQINNSYYQRLIQHMLHENPDSRPDISGLAEMTEKEIHQNIVDSYTPRVRYNPPPAPIRESVFLNISPATLFAVRTDLGPVLAVEPVLEAEEAFQAMMMAS